MNKSLVFLFVVGSLLSACSNADLTRLIKPRHHGHVVKQQSVKRSRPVQQRQVIMYPQRRMLAPVPKRTAQSCTYIMRDLSKSHASTVWCYPGRNY